jgi:hypothetical protein
MCSPGSATSRSSGSAWPTFAVGKPTSPAAPATPPSCNAGRWSCGSCSSPWTKTPSTAIPSARCPRPGVAPIPIRSWTRPSAGPSPRRGWSPAGPVPAVLVGPRALSARHRAAVRRAGGATPAAASTSTASCPCSRSSIPVSGRPVRQRLQAPAQERRRHPRASPGPAGGGGRPPPAAARQRSVGPGVHRPWRWPRPPRRGRGAKGRPDRAVAPQLPSHLPGRAGQAGRPYRRAATDRGPRAQGAPSRRPANP